MQVFEHLAKQDRVEGGVCVWPERMLHIEIIDSHAKRFLTIGGLQLANGLQRTLAKYRCSERRCNL